MSNSGKEKKRIVQYLMKDLDQNWFSFFSGILANIPIGIFLAMQKYGESTVAHLFFWGEIAVLILSSATVWFAFKLTILKIQVEKNAEIEYEKWVQQNHTTSIQAKDDCIDTVFAKQENKARTYLCFLCWLGGLMFLSIIGLWVIYNYI